MLKILLVLLGLLLLWLASRQLSRARAIQLAMLGAAGFSLNVWRAWGQGLTIVELINYNFSQTSMLLINLASMACCLLSLLVLVREMNAGPPEH